MAVEKAKMAILGGIQRQQVGAVAHSCRCATAVAITWSRMAASGNSAFRATKDIAKPLIGHRTKVLVAF